jgi:O-antigen/teichoic acid export membrane protein
MAEELRDRGVRRLLPIWHDTTHKLALLFFPFVGLLISNAYQLITVLFTKSYAASVPIFMVWCLSILMAAFQTDGVLRVFAQMRYLFTINVVRLVVVLVMMGWFLSSFKLLGAVFITLIGILLAKLMALARIRRVLETSVTELLPWKNLAGIMVAAILAAIPAVLINRKLDLPALVLLPLSGMAYTATYGALVLAFGLGKDEVAAIKRSFYVWNRRSVESARQAGIGR